MEQRSGRRAGGRVHGHPGGSRATAMQGGSPSSASTLGRRRRRRGGESEDVDLDAVPRRPAGGAAPARHHARRHPAQRRGPAPGAHQRTARENVADLVDPGTFVDHGPLAVAAQRRRRTIEELIEKSPGDGMITGVGSVNGDQFGDPEPRSAVMAYDFTVFAGTQGVHNHRKTDRLIDIAEQGRRRCRSRAGCASRRTPARRRTSRCRRRRRW